MCQVAIRNRDRSNLDFIIYNHLFSQDSDTFTIKELTRDLNEKYHLGVSEKEVRTRIYHMSAKGLVSQNVDNYTICNL